MLEDTHGFGFKESIFFNFKTIPQLAKLCLLSQTMKNKIFVWIG